MDKSKDRVIGETFIQKIITFVVAITLGGGYFFIYKHYPLAGILILIMALGVLTALGIAAKVKLSILAFIVSLTPIIGGFHAYLLSEREGGEFFGGSVLFASIFAFMDYIREELPDLNDRELLIVFMSITSFSLVFAFGGVVAYEFWWFSGIFLLSAAMFVFICVVFITLDRMLVKSC